MNGIEATHATSWLERGVTFLQTVIAGVLVVLLLLGVVNLGITVGRSVLALDVLDAADTLALVRSTVDVVLYLFVVVELYRTIVAYVEAKSVVMAVIHAGLLAVVRQIITFKPDEYAPTEAITVAGVYTLLLVGLLVGFRVVHDEIDEATE